MINLVSHFSDIGFAMFLGIVLSLVSKATCTSPPRKEFVTTLANAGLGRIISGLFKTIFALIDSLVNKISSIVVSHVLSTIERTSDKFLMLYGGKFRWAGSIDEFKESNDPYVFQFRHGKLDGPMQPKDI